MKSLNQPSLLLIPLLGVMVALSLSISIVNAVIVNNTDFSIEVPNGWVYREHYVFENGTISAPNEFADFLINTSALFNVTDGVVMAEFAPDDRFPLKNAPVEIYANHSLKVVRGMYPTYENATIGGERAIRVFVNSTDVASKLGKTDIPVSLASVSYSVIRDDQPYFLNYMANAKDYQKYLPQFEQMVKSLNFTK